MVDLFHAGRPDALRLGVIQERLLVHGIEINDETLIADLEYLRELELVELVGEPGGGHYVLAIPRIGTWIEKQLDFAAIKRKAKLEPVNSRHIQLRQFFHFVVI